MWSGTPPRGEHARRRAIGIGIFALGATLAACGGASDPGGTGPPGGNDDDPPVTLEAGDTVAMMELAAPEATTFILHGTIPLPKGVYPSSDGTIPFGVLDYEGSAVPAQVQPVSWYPEEWDGADVVEVIARVRRDPAVSPGERVQYGITVAPHPEPADPGTAGIEDLVEGTLDVPASVQALLSNPDSIVISSADVFGNLYFADPLGDGKAELMRYGGVQSQVRTYNTMIPPVPVGGSQGTLPHLFGVHSYISTLQDEEVILLDLRFHNAHDGADKTSPTQSNDDPLGIVYFDGIEILVPNGWTVIQAVPDPGWGAPYVVGGITVFPLLDENDDGTLHVMGPYARFHRRLALTPIGNETRAQQILDQDGIAFCVRGWDPTTNDAYFSWWNPLTARYFPQSHTLPQLDHVGLESLRSTLTSEYNKLKNYKVTGTKETAGGTKPGGIYPVPSEQMGWAQPYGVSVGGMVGGDEIFLYDGVRVACSASNEGYLDFQLRHRMATDRQCGGVYDKNGHPSSPEDWVMNDGSFDYMPFIWFNGQIIGNSDPMGFEDSPDFQRQEVANLNLEPDYEQELLEFVAIDYQHYVRYTRNAKVLAWLGNDSVAKDDLRAAAESFRLGYAPYPLSGGGGQEIGMYTDLMEATVDPGAGLSYGRGEGHGLDSVVAAYALSDDWNYRNRVRDWSEIVIQIVHDGQSVNNGFISRIIGKKFNYEYYFRQSISQAIVENAFHGMKKTMWEGRDQNNVDDINDVLLTSWYAMIGEMSWWGNDENPWAHVALGPKNATAAEMWSTHAQQLAELPMNCNPAECEVGHSDYHDDYQIGSSLALAYEMTGDQEFLDKALTHTKNFLPGQTLLEKLELDGTKNIWNRCVLVALAQELGD